MAVIAGQQKQRATKELLKVVVIYQQKLNQADRDVITELDARVKRGATLMLFECEQVEQCYEKIMKVLGMPAVERKRDIDTRRKLRF